MFFSYANLVRDLRKQVFSANECVTTAKTLCGTIRLRLQGDVINENEQSNDHHDTRHRVNGLRE